MGYFANGDEGTRYEEQFCYRCVHNDDCGVLMAHMVYNYEQLREGAEKIRELLSTLIPYEDGKNGPCTMFVKERSND